MAKLIMGCGRIIEATTRVKDNTIIIETKNSPGMVIDFTNDEVTDIVLYLDLTRGNVLPFKPPG